MPDKIEFKKYGGSVNFLRKVLERCGYELIPRDNPNPPPEMEALMEWMLGDTTALANDVSPLSFSAVDARVLYAAPGHRVCIISGHRQYADVLHSPHAPCPRSTKKNTTLLNIFLGVSGSTPSSP
jgi:hypothetical protein